MSKISAVDFANSVEANRKKLIQHCVENGKEVSSTASLDTVVGVTNTINETQPEGTYKVEFKDIDGSYFAPVQYVQAGGDATIPSETPSFDSEYLEFVEWKTSASDPLTNVQRDILALPFYRTKYDETLGQRPTYLICYFDSTTLSPTLKFGEAPKYVNTYILWGDGSAAQQVTASTMSHTYANPGIYTITIYGDTYDIGGDSSNGLFTNSTYRWALLKAYLGENIQSRGASLGTSYDLYNAFKYCCALTCATLPAHLTDFGAVFSNCWSLRSIVYPSGTIYIGSSACNMCKSLTDVIIPNGVKKLLSNAFSYCVSLSNIQLPSSVEYIAQQCFYYCKALKELVIPESVLSVMNESSSATDYGGLVSNCASLKKLTILSNSIPTIPQAFVQQCYSLEEFIIPSSVTKFSNPGGVFNSCYNLKEITIPASLQNFNNSMLSFTECTSLKTINLYQDFNNALGLRDNPLTTDCLIDIALKLKDNSASNAKTIGFSKNRCKTRLETTYIDSNGAIVPFGTEGAVSLLEYIQNKNWTVALSDSQNN